ncbi:MAG: PepSY domain-containing protein [Mediterranea sp.]|jgi:hypothetical protein|nr:PepSY domain-containing protein [Mediterranea sp.]
MKKSTWRKHHKWFGLLFGFFLLMFCLSGIVLNHRTLVSDINVGRGLLPPSYRYSHWNNGLLRGTLRYADTLLVYGGSGVWRTDSLASFIADFNQGLPGGADFRNIRGVVRTADGELFAAGQFGLYSHQPSGEWEETPLPLDAHERLTDLVAHGDTLIAVGRSRLYVSTLPYREFRPLTLKAPTGYDGRVSLFRTVWLLHSGELFGVAGKVLMDIVALVLILLTFTGILYWLLPKYIIRARKAGRKALRGLKLIKGSLAWHNKLGAATIILTLFVSVTGWMLRPPVLIALAQGRVPAIPGTTLSSPNAWNDKLRMMRYDEAAGDWLLSTSEGFYALRRLDDIPREEPHTPPVSVMGLNVFAPHDDGYWLAGSFSGLYLWDRKKGTSIDCFTGLPATNQSGPPFGQRAIAGYSRDFAGREFAVDYKAGTDAIAMPPWMAKLPMSLWNLCLEIHTGRIYTFLGNGTLVYIFFAGLIVAWVLWSGYRIRRGKAKGAT